MTQPPQYERLLRQEADHWGSVRPDPANPQIWHDQALFDIFFGREYAMLIDCVLARGPRVLELGCGEGSLAIALAQRGLFVTALDLSEDRLSRARQKAEAAGVANRITFQPADLNTVTLPLNTYSCIVAHDSLHHILSLDHLFSEVSKALVTDGAFVVMDYIGMGTIRKLLAAGLFAILPTVQPYAEKWQLRRRLRGFLASEKRKRAALTGPDTSLLHSNSPFEEISQSSILDLLQKRFSVQQSLSFLPFWFYLAPKILVPRRMKYPFARLLRTLDNGLRALGLRGAYVFVDSRKLDNAPIAS